MTDRAWTADEAYRILRDTLDRFISGEGSATSLQDWLLNEFATPPDPPQHHPVQNLYRLATTDLAVYLQCDFARPSLEASLREAIELVESGEVIGFTKMTRSPCFVALMRQGQIPAPLINITERNFGLIWEHEGFQDS
jgi:hypothetical protein